jgi:dCMP deaminase
MSWFDLFYDDRKLLKLKAFIKFANQLGDLSTCKRRRVGAIIFPEDFTEVLAIGYNGPPSGIANNSCKDISARCGCVHAEANAIVKLQTHKENLVIYSTVTPCEHCAGLIINTKKIKYCLYSVQYSNDEGLDKLLKAGIETRKLTEIIDDFS